MRFVVPAIVTIVVAALVWLFIIPTTQDISEIGRRALPVTVLVVDGETNKPITNALVRIHDHDGQTAEGHSEGRADADGRLNLAPEMTWTSFGNWYRRRGSIRFWDKGITVTSAGYEPLDQELEKYTGGGRPLSDLSPVSVVVKMKPKAQD